MIRKLMALMGCLLLALSMTACTNPMDTYKKTIQDQGLEASIQTLLVDMDSLYEAAGLVDTSDPNASADSEEAFLQSLGLSMVSADAQVVLKDINAIEDSLMAMALDLSDEEVSALHRQLLDPLEAYTDKVELVAKSSDAMIEIMGATYQMYTLSNALSSQILSNYLSLSETFLGAFLDNQALLEEALAILSDGSFMNMLDSGQVDMTYIDETLLKMSEVNDLIATYEAENETDQAVKDYLIDLVDSVEVMLMTIKDNSEVLGQTAGYDSIQAFLDTVRAEGRIELEGYLAGIQ